MFIIQILFWVAIIWVFYSTFGYAIIIWLFSQFIHPQIIKAEITPSVSFLIAAHNEDQVIAGKLENTLALDYPKNKLQIIVMSDASTDRTHEIVTGFIHRGVSLNIIPVNGGKPNAMNLTFPSTTGEIILISDADSKYSPDALKKLVQNFADPSVGAVTGEERRIANQYGVGLGESIYNLIDNFIKHLEGKIGSMVMVNGGFVAIRHELFPILDPKINFDLVWAPLLYLQKYRTVYEPEALSVEVYPLDSKKDFRRRVRTVLQAFYSYLSIPQALNPFRTGWYALRLLSHRFVRWFVIPWLGVALLSSVFLAEYSLVYQILFFSQFACYLVAGIGWIIDSRGKRLKFFYIPYYFIYIHLAAFVAVIQAIAGKRVASWTPTQREQIGIK